MVFGARLDPILQLAFDMILYTIRDGVELLLWKTRAFLSFQISHETSMMMDVKIFYRDPLRCNTADHKSLTSPKATYFFRFSFISPNPSFIERHIRREYPELKRR
jgi:hypothetical protein